MIQKISYLFFIFFQFALVHSKAFSSVYNKPNMIILLGNPGAGKGTIAQKLSVTLHYPIVANGDLMKNLQNDSKTIEGKALKLLDDSDYRIPELMRLGLIIQEIEKINFDYSTNGVIIDSYPKSLDAAKIFYRLYKNRFNIHVIYLDISEELMLKRISKRLVCRKCNLSFSVDNPDEPHQCPHCQQLLIRRKADQKGALRLLDRTRRNNEFFEKTFDFYSKKNIFLKIDGSKPLEEKLNRILKEIR